VNYKKLKICFSKSYRSFKKKIKKFPSEHGLHSVIFAVIASSVFIYEFFDHFQFNLRTPIKNWVDTATYFNNILSPILFFASILLLYRTWKDTKQALDFQRTELKIQRENFEKQIKNQEVKDKLEIFSRRVRELSDKFTNKKVKDLLADLEFSRRMSELTVNSIDNDIISVFRVNESSSTSIQEAVKEYDKNKFSALFTRSYCYVSSITLESVFSEFFYEIGDDKDFYDMLKLSKEMPDYFVKYIIAYALISSEKTIVEIRAFNSLLRQINQLEKEIKTLFIDELLLNFKYELAQALIKINKDIPDDVLES